MSASIAVVVLDCLRADYFEQHFDWVPGRIFSNAYSTSHWSIPAHASLLTGAYASEIGTHAKSPSLDVDDKTIPEVLCENGYHTRLWTQNHQLSSWDGWQRRFDEVLGPDEITALPGNTFDWDDFADRTTDNDFVRVLRAIPEVFFSSSDVIPSILEGYYRYNQESTLPSVRRRLQRTDFGKQDFLLLNLMEMHQPYAAPSRYSRTETPVEIDHLDNYRDSSLDTSTVRTAYEDCARYLSEEYKNIFEYLTESFDLIITLADHGEHLGEHGRWSHEYGLAEELVHIPLNIWTDDIASSVDPTPVSIIDVPETIADYLSLDFDSRGQSLLSDVHHRDRLTEYHGVMAFQEPQFREAGLEREFHAADTPRNGIVLSNGYGYEDERGFCEFGKISEDAELRMKQLREQIPWDEGSDDWMTGQNQFVDNDIKSRLEDLGYL